jgi:metal-dependent amidase/aminoacylase/carboxypeptidase family protein
MPKARARVRAAARATLALEALTDTSRNRVVNVGILRGGAARQVVPHEAEMHVDIRAALPEDVAALENDVKKLLAETGDPRVSVRIEGGWTRPVFPETPASRCTSWPSVSPRRSARPSTRSSRAAARTAASPARWASRRWTGWGPSASTPAAGAKKSSSPASLKGAPCSAR